MKPTTVFLAEMTNPEVEGFLKEHDTVIVPVGSMEQHGPAGPISTDVLIPQEIARRIAPQIGAAVAPPISYALSYPHRGFTSEFSLRIDTFMAVIEDLCVALAEAGFCRIIFLNGHFDNTFAIAYGCARAADKLPEGVRAFPVNYGTGCRRNKPSTTSASPKACMPMRARFRPCWLSTPIWWIWSVPIPSFRTSLSTAPLLARCTPPIS